MYEQYESVLPEYGSRITSSSPNKKTAQFNLRHEFSFDLRGKSFFIIPLMGIGVSKTTGFSGDSPSLLFFSSKF